MTFALYFGNRGLFPGWVIADARRELQEACRRNGYDCLLLEESATRYGAVETCREGEIYARFLEKHAGQYDGVILCLPNFGDENGVCTALEGVKVPILIQAYPDESGRMSPELRRDAYCGKLAVCNLLRQCGIPFSLTEQFAVSPTSPSFDRDLHRFAALCRTVNGMRRFRIGVFGARTTPFKTTRYDEMALQKKGITVETFDLSEVFDKMDCVSDAELQTAQDLLSAYACFNTEPRKLQNQAALLAVLQQYIADYGLSAIAVRCWEEFEKRYGIAPCVAMSYLTEQGIPAACETDVPSAIMMRAMTLAADTPAMLLDVNNNYGNDPQRCILFHCGVSPASRMTEQPQVCCHRSFDKFGSCPGTVAGGLLSGPVTVGNLRTEEGQLYAFVGEGALTDDPIDDNFFGTASVFSKANLPAMLTHMARNGYKHHTVVAPGELADIVEEAFSVYLGYNTTVI